MASPMSQAGLQFCKTCFSNVSRVVMRRKGLCPPHRPLQTLVNERKSFCKQYLARNFINHRKECCRGWASSSGCFVYHCETSPSCKCIPSNTQFPCCSRLKLMGTKFPTQKHGLLLYTSPWPSDVPYQSIHTHLQLQNGFSSRGQKEKDKSEQADNILDKQRRLKEAFKSRVADLSEDIKTVPNLLTLLRMVSAPVIGSLVIHQHFTLAVGLFAFAGITDLMDGYIARNFKNQKSVLGTILDPLADKLLVTVLAVTLTMVDLIPVPLVALIIARDVALIAAVFYIRYLSLPSPKTIYRYFDLTLPTAKLYPSNLSKVNTALQLSLVAFTLAAPVFDYVDHPYLQILWYVTAFTTFTSGLQYVSSSRSYFKILQQKSDKHPNR